MSESLDLEKPDKTKHRGKGRGSNFMVLGKANFDVILRAQTNSRTNLLSAYLVLLAGTGADHTLTKWSAKACEDKVGIGRPRAKLAIAELVRAGLVELVENFDPRKPQYRLQPPSTKADEIFLPVQLITGLADEPSLWRRVKEANDFLMMRMLIQLYASVQIDRTFAPPLSAVRTSHKSSSNTAQQIFEIGVHKLWHLPRPDIYDADENWMLQCVGAKNPDDEFRDIFWGTFKKLLNLGAIYTEDWVFDSNDKYAEPLFPVHIDQMFEGDEDKVGHLTRLLFEASHSNVGEKYYILDQYADGLVVPLPAHCSPPALRGLVKLRIEPDTPGCRSSYGARIRTLNHFVQAFQKASIDFRNDKHDIPISLAVPERT